MKVQIHDKMTVLRPPGDLTIFEVANFHRALFHLYSHENPIGLDLSQVERTDSSGI